MSDSKKKRDLTRLEDISDFIHTNDPEIDAQLDSYHSSEDLPQMPEDDDFIEDEPSALHEEFGQASEIVEVSEFSSNDEEYEHEDNIGEAPWDPDENIDSTSEVNLEDESFESEDLSVLQSIGGQTDSFEIQSGQEEMFTSMAEDPLPETHISETDNYESFENSQVVEEINEPVVVPKENFKDLAEFGKTISPTQSAAPGNPPYTLLIKNISYEEEGQEILRILSEFGVLDQDNRSTFEKSIETGNVIVSQLGEYLAVQICHKLRNNTFDIEMGLSEKIHPSDLYSGEERGLVHRGNIRQNKELHFYKRPKEFVIEDVQLTTTPNLENKNIVEYLGVITEHELVHEHELYQDKNLSENEFEITNITREIKELLSDDEIAESTLAGRYQGTLAEIYEGLTYKLRQKAYELGATAVVNINFQLTPLSALQAIQSIDSKESRYKITCTGNAVLAKNPED
ncbi:MAG: hypothetical protein H6622_05240 [Halobacteriovoraceae bacterium]|nr:hypothetical protein [Halobacteriovoraceae bacterium]